MCDNAMTIQDVFEKYKDWSGWTTKPYPLDIPALWFAIKDGLAQIAALRDKLEIQDTELFVKKATIIGLRSALVTITAERDALQNKYITSAEVARLAEQIVALTMHLQERKVRYVDDGYGTWKCSGCGYRLFWKPAYRRCPNCGVPINDAGDYADKA